MTVLPLWIDGQQRPSSSNETFTVHNPYSNEVVTTAACATSQDVKDAIEAAGRAFKTWEYHPLPERRDIFLRAADLLASEKYKKRVIEAMADETAATEAWAMVNWAVGIDMLKWTSGLINDFRGESFPSGVVPGAQVVVQRRAMGVILAIAPWNAPIILTFRSVAIPIIAGNTVVLKASEFSPRTQSLIVEVFHEAGLPNGVLNFLPISKEKSPTLVPEIIAHPLVRKLNFTGSDRVGRILAAEAAKYLKPCVFELGGKSPCVVLEDADVEQAARAIAFSSMMHSGQICMSTERVIVQRKASEALIAAVKNHVQSFTAGNPISDPSHALSALFHEGSASNVIGMIKEAVEANAELLLGDLNKEGAVVQPHLLQLKDVKPGLKAWERESFGPVTVFAVVDTVDEAVELANATEYSLAAALWTKDVHKAFDVGARIRSGITSVNGPTFHSEPNLGDVGLGGASGYGRFDLDNFTDKRMIVFNPPHREYPLVG